MLDRPELSFFFDINELHFVGALLMKLTIWTQYELLCRFFRTTEIGFSLFHYICLINFINV